MAPSKVILIRHGQAESNLHGGQPNLPDPPLTPAGEAQCAYLATTLSALPYGFNLVLTSPLLRTLQTTLFGPIAAKPTPSVKVLPELQETGNVPSDTPRKAVLNLERLQEQTRDIKVEDWDWTDTVSERRPDRENWLHNRGLFEYSTNKNMERAKFVRQLLYKFDGVIVIVAHGAFIRYLLGQTVSIEDEWQKGYYYNNCEARAYRLQDDVLIDEEVIHIGGHKRPEKEEGKVATTKM